MEQILLAASPFVVTFVTNWFKGLKPFAKMKKGQRKDTLRLTVGLLSFLAVVGSSYITGRDLPTDVVQGFVDTILVFLGSSGIYFLGKK